MKNSRGNNNGNTPNVNYDDTDMTDEDEDLPVVALKQEDKIKVVKGMMLLFFFSSVVIYSLIYCNVPMQNVNILFQGTDNNGEVPERSLERYKVISRRIHKNSIQLKVIESNNRNSSPLNATFVFSKNRMRLKVVQERGRPYEIPMDMFESNDLELKSIGAIESIAESSIGIHINTNPFGFELFRKQTNETLFSTIKDNETNDTVFKFNKSYLQIATRLCDDHLTFGLGSDNSSLRASDGAFEFWYNWTKGRDDKSFLSIPNFISGNPKTKNFFGSFMFSSAPMKIVMKENTIAYQIYSDIIDLIIVNGPKPRDIIIQLQKTFGMPFVPSLQSLNWQGNVILPKEGAKEKLTQIDFSNLLFPFKEMYIDDIYHLTPLNEIAFVDKDTNIEFIRYLKPVIDVSSDDYDEAVKLNVCLAKDSQPFIVTNDESRFCLIDQFHPNASTYYRSYPQTNKFNVVQQIFDSVNNVSFKAPFMQNDYPIPLNSTFYDSSTMMKVHNIYSMKQVKNLYDIIRQRGERPVIFSQNTFIGSAQYTGKWLGYFENSWKGFKDAIRMTLKFNLLGLYGLIHEACGFHLFNEKDAQGDELCVRWIQFSSVSSFARINGFETLSSYGEQYKKNIFNSIKLRETLSIYIYSTMIRNSYEGGSILFPMFAYFMSDTQTLPTENLFKFEYQFLMGPNIMACPIVEPNQSEITVYFPNEILYDFYTGELVNRDKEQIRTIKVDLNQLPLFTRGGFITPIQIPPEDKPVLIEEMRKYPIKLIVSLDENYQAQGRLFIDDGRTPGNAYVKIEFVCLYNSIEKEMKLLLQFVENDYKIPTYHYGYFNQISFYGLRAKPSMVLFQQEDTSIQLYPQDNPANPYEAELIYTPHQHVLHINLNTLSPLKVYSSKPYHLVLRDIPLFT